MIQRICRCTGVGVASVLGWLMLCNAGHAADFGAAFPEGAKSTTLAAAIDRGAADGSHQPEVISGRIVEVCQNKGCWVMLEDDGKAARVMMRDHAFSVPRDARGAALIHGNLSRITLSEATAAHLAEDAGHSEPVRREEWRIDALAVRIADTDQATP